MMSHCATLWPAVPQPDEYEKLGSYALIGLPDDQYPTRWGGAWAVVVLCVGKSTCMQACTRVCMELCARLAVCAVLCRGCGGRVRLCRHALLSSMCRHGLVARMRSCSGACCNFVNCSFKPQGEPAAWQP